MGPAAAPRGGARESQARGRRRAAAGAPEEDAGRVGAEEERGAFCEVAVLEDEAAEPEEGDGGEDEAGVADEDAGEGEGAAREERAEGAVEGWVGGGWAGGWV